jgi:hypothetical protein
MKPGPLAKDKERMQGEGGFFEDRRAQSEELAR